MTNRKFERAARINKTKAFLLTAALHVVLIGGIASYGEGSFADYVPGKVKDLLGWDQPVDDMKNNDEEVAMRP